MMNMSIEEKFTKLSPEAQNAAEAFIDFLLSREEGEFSLDEDMSEEPVRSDNEPFPKPGCDEPSASNTDGSGIILAEERMIEEESVIDFADINTRFAPKDSKNTGKEKTGPIRQKRMFDWL